MLNISAQQLADLLIGIARAQAAMVNGLENELPGVRSNRVAPAVQNQAHLHDHPSPTLVDLPVRILLSSLGRVGPDPAVIVRELERLFSGAAPAATPSAPGSGTTVAGPSAGSELDFTAS